MIPSEVLKKIRRIQIRSSHRVDELLAGTWHSAFKGRGIEFEEVRPYQVGDDVRAIDWNVTARSNQPFVKLFREERELAVQLVVDVSASQDFGTDTQTKRELVTELGATLAMSAIKNNDRVGLTLFTGRIEKSMPPRKGKRHVLRLIRELLYYQATDPKTNISVALEHLNRTQQRRCVVFLISDFFDSDFERALRIASRKHDVIPVIVADQRERELPAIGLIRLRDAETGQVIVVDTSSRRQREIYRQIQQQQFQDRQRMFRSLNLAPIHLHTGHDIAQPLQRYFHQRERHA